MQLNDCSGGGGGETDLDASTTCHVPSVGDGDARVHGLGATGATACARVHDLGATGSTACARVHDLDATMAWPGRRAFGGLAAYRSEIRRTGEWEPSSASMTDKTSEDGQG